MEIRDRGQSKAEVAAAAGGATPRLITKVWRLRAEVWPGVGRCGEDGFAREKRPGSGLKAGDGGSQAGRDSTVAASRTDGWVTDAYNGVRVAVSFASASWSPIFFQLRILLFILAYSQCANFPRLSPVQY